MAKPQSESEFDNMGDFTLHLLLWLFLPGMAATFLQKAYYSFRFKPSSPYRPTPGSPRFKKDYDNFYIVVIAVYLAYCIFSSIYLLPLNYYDDFGVSLSSTEKDIKVKFRKYSLAYHPDRNPVPEAEGEFMRLRKIYEAITNPVLREVYNKFGSSMTCNGCILFKDYLWNALMHFIGFYGPIALLLIILNIVGSGQFATYWRFIAFFGMMILEASMIILPYDPISWFLPNSTVSEKISVIRQGITYIFLAIGQFGPILFPQETADFSESLHKLQKQIDQQSSEASKYFKSQMNPFIDDKDKYRLLKAEIEKKSVHVKLYENDDDYRTLTSKFLSPRRKS